jgi:hypothetical protein
MRHAYLGRIPCGLVAEVAGAAPLHRPGVQASGESSPTPTQPHAAEHGSGAVAERQAISACCVRELPGFWPSFPPPERAQALHLALRALRARVEPDQVLMCELAWEVHRHGYRSQLCRDDGSPYDCEETYFREVAATISLANQIPERIR